MGLAWLVGAEVVVVVVVVLVLQVALTRRWGAPFCASFLGRGFVAAALGREKVDVQT